MARLFDGVGDYLSMGSGPVVYPFTVAVEFILLTGATTGLTLWSQANSGAGNNRHVLYLGRDDGFPEIGRRVGVLTQNTGTWESFSAIATSDCALDVWQHGSATWTDNSNRSVFLNGGNKGANSTAPTAPSGHDAMEIGRNADSTPNWDWDGQLSRMAIWKVALTDEEHAMLGLGISPLQVRPAGLIHLWRMDGNTSPEPDIVGKLDGTINGTPSKSVGPRIFMPARQIFQFPASAGSAPSFSAGPVVQDQDDNSYTLSATADANSTWYAVAVKRGESAPTAAQIKLGQNSASVAAEAAVNKSVTQAVADTMTLGGSLDLPLYDIYTVLNNAGGDSSVASLVGEFLDPATGKQFQTVTILDVASVTNANPPVVGTDLVHNFSTGQLIRPYGGDMTQFDATHANYAGATSPTPDDGLKYFQITVLTTTTFELDGLDSTGWDAYTGGADCPAGFSFFEGASPAVVDDDIWEADSVTVPDTFNITLFPDGTLTYDAGGDGSQQRIVMRVYDISAEAWTANVTQYFNNTKPSLKVAFPDPVRFLRNVAFSLTPIKDIFVEDIDDDVLTLTSLTGAPTSIVIGGGGDSIEGTTADAASTGNMMTLRVTDEAGDFTDFVINFDVIATFAMPDVDDGDKTEATAISDITGAGLQSPAVKQAFDPATTIGNVWKQTPAATTVHAVDEPTSITVSEHAGELYDFIQFIDWFFGR